MTLGTLDEKKPARGGPGGVGGVVVSGLKPVETLSHQGSKTQGYGDDCDEHQSKVAAHFAQVSFYKLSRVGIHRPNFFKSAGTS